jgi:hypothetical protein
MRAIFVARGPAFPHEPHSLVEAFQNINLYNIICDSLEIEPSPNSGTIRLPFTTTGKHDDADAPVRDDPEDFVPDDHPAAPATTPLETPTDPNAPIGTNVGRLGDDDDPFDKDNKIQFHQGTGKSLWGWITDGFNNVLDKVKGIFGGKKGDDDDED